MKKGYEVYITRRSKLGFGYNVTPDTTKGYPAIEPVDEPSYIGTIKQILVELAEDLNYQSMRSVFMNTAWFVKIDGTWHKLKKNYYYQPADLVYLTMDDTFLYEGLSMELDD